MIIHCQDRYDAMVKYAESINDKTLSQCFESLKKKEEVSKERGFDTTIHVYKDHEEHSFYFEEIYADGRRGLNGGILYHGKPGEQDNSMAVCIDGRAYGWRTHT